ncbi:hypothetical protein [Paenibacillus mucilaginosus]|uniref:HEAT repeat domain-containing protein n=2 Tax=Paenibacillus mucilaginosus TaxID=61624 RepID=H6NIG2_9BACL|nr:hypothetical protein [Paenibacillus mucilaginosus]AEI42669.1 hypothetical protein KNP414_04137 [Paenibacillus mucilaginosus KNP414]AFC32273.1 hypothetical protein PM3016_5581 [Paenibacillus mucilaginosus 3016]MCG7217082.1 hypothetical protein [Paenibacillus mucilaginosus]WDM26058.1 hypothetical protein KCX80_26980 [Paenibacillus mucilaginosus]WFA20775.1 hypothetical protein ERY13_27770 [Paenibacillus mucilaginosus]
MIAEHPGLESLLTGLAADGSFSQLLKALDTSASQLSGVELQAFKHRSLQAVESALLSDPAKLMELALRFTETDSETGQEMAVFLLTGQYALHPGPVSDRLKRLAGSPHAPVRKWAAEACGTLLVKHFDSFSLQLVDWVTDRVPTVRLSALHAIRAAAKTRNPVWAGTLFDLLEPLLRDTHADVKKTLSVHTLGPLLLPAYPEEITHRLSKWIGSADSNVRVHAVYLFASGEVSAHWDRLSRSWKRLLKDPTPAVQKAVLATLKHVEKRTPERISSLRIGSGLRSPAPGYKQAL